MERCSLEGRGTVLAVYLSYCGDFVAHVAGHDLASVPFRTHALNHRGWALVPQGQCTSDLRSTASSSCWPAVLIMNWSASQQRRTQDCKDLPRLMVVASKKPETHHSVCYIIVVSRAGLPRMRNRAVPWLLGNRRSILYAFHDGDHSHIGPIVSTQKIKQGWSDTRCIARKYIAMAAWTHTESQAPIFQQKEGWEALPSTISQTTEC